ncbi:15517_t:CDS:2 [Dentiscutata erythropus]|uniref:15517_t:CDS:1 n=1 Tax=Dentiscutata erythropus TaxID=1348616 RepID=A0A9N9N809_9GLOM|nr:15517_t:CDS:2 [Dentiscutata erythropus]
MANQLIIVLGTILIAPLNVENLALKSPGFVDRDRQIKNCNSFSNIPLTNSFTAGQSRSNNRFLPRKKAWLLSIKGSDWLKSNNVLSFDQYKSEWDSDSTSLATFNIRHVKPGK